MIIVRRVLLSLGYRIQHTSITSISKISVPIFKRSSWQFQNTPDLLNLMGLEPCYGHVKKIKVFQNWFDIQFREAVFMHFCFWLFSQPIIIRKMTSGGVLESSGPPLDDRHKDFENWCRIGWENWSWSWQPQFENWQKIMIDYVILKKDCANCIMLYMYKLAPTCSRGRTCPQPLYSRPPSSPRRGEQRTGAWTTPSPRYSPACYNTQWLNPRTAWTICFCSELQWRVDEWDRV